jgi:hypothetical protein
LFVKELELLSLPLFSLPGYSTKSETRNNEKVLVVVRGHQRISRVPTVGYFSTQSWSGCPYFLPHDNNRGLTLSDRRAGWIHKWNRHPVLGGPTIIRQPKNFSQRTLDGNLPEIEKNIFPDSLAETNQNSQARSAL